MEVYVKSLVGELSRSHEVLVFSRGLRQGLRSGETYESREKGATITRVFVDLREISDFSEVYDRPWLDALFKAYLEKVQPEVVHFQHLGGLSLGLIQTATDCGLPVIMTLSDHQPFCPRGQRIRDDKRVCKTIALEECVECLKPQCAGHTNRPAKLAAYLLGKQKGKDLLRQMHERIAECFAQVAFFIMPSEFHKEKMVEAGAPGDRCRVLPYGLDLSLLDRVPNRKPGQPVRRFGYLGTLIPSKGVEDVILAFKKMKSQGCSLHIYGEAVPYHGLLDYHKRLVELARAADISFYGPYQPQDLPAVLAQIDALVMPSRWFESYGITIREAFRARRPVIVSNIGAFTEAVTHMENGLVFPAGDVFELAKMMDLLATNLELANQLATAGGPITGLAEHADELLKLYAQAKSGKG